MDNEPCVENPTATARKTYCSANQYCSTFRREYWPSIQSICSQMQIHSKPNQIFSITQQPATASIASSEEKPKPKQSKEGEGSPAINTDEDPSRVMPASTRNSSVQTSIGLTDQSPRVHITRGCRSPNVFSETDNESSFVEFCMTDYCNIGDGSE